jgi:hypothetical protein
MLPAQPGNIEVRAGIRVEVRLQNISARMPRPLSRSIALRVSRGMGWASPRRKTLQVAVRTRAARSAALICLVFSAWLFLAGCGAPGLPTPPSPPIPAAVSDLTARQSGDGALLSFTLPGKTITGQRLTENPACEIFRGTVKADGSADAKSFRMVYAIPGTMVANYIVDKHLEFLDPLSPEETRVHPGGQVAYLVRTRISPKKASLDSNIVEVPIFPVPQRITHVDVRVTESAMELSWSPVAQTSGGESIRDVSYRLYRGQLNQPADQAAMDAAAKDLVHARWKSPLTLLASPATTSYRDTDFAFDQTYVYVVRTAGTGPGGALESADSVPAIVSPQDVFPPSAPQGLAAAVLEGNDVTPMVDLSWSISPESDVAGYHVYRSEQEGQRGTAISTELVPTPSYRDSAIQPGHRYWYTVTAVDRAGNESLASAPVLAELAPPGT